MNPEDKETMQLIVLKTSLNALFKPKYYKKERPYDKTSIGDENFDSRMDSMKNPDSSRQDSEKADYITKVYETCDNEIEEYCEFTLDYFSWKYTHLWDIMSSKKCHWGSNVTDVNNSTPKLMEKLKFTKSAISYTGYKHMRN